MRGRMRTRRLAAHRLPARRATRRGRRGRRAASHADHPRTRRTIPSPPCARRAFRRYVRTCASAIIRAPVVVDRRSTGATTRIRKGEDMTRRGRGGAGRGYLAAEHALGFRAVGHADHRVSGHVVQFWLSGGVRRRPGADVGERTWVRKTADIAFQGASSSGAPRSGGSRPGLYRARPRGRPGDSAEVRGARLDVVLLQAGEVVRLMCGICDAVVWEESRLFLVNEPQEDGRGEAQDVDSSSIADISMPVRRTSKRATHDDAGCTAQEYPFGRAACYRYRDHPMAFHHSHGSPRRTCTRIARIYDRGCDSQRRTPPSQCRGWVGVRRG
jgi:hypothetical protein